MEENYDKLVDEAYNLHVAGKLEEAKLKYEKLLELDSENLDVANLYAQLNFALKNYDIALKYFNKIYEQTELDEIKVNIVKVYIAQENFEQAAKELETIKDKNAYKSDFNLNVIMAEYYEKIEDNKKQLEFLLNAAEINPSVELLFNIGVLYRKAGDNENALEYFKAVCEIEPENKNALLNIANIFENHDKNVSIAIYTELAKKYSNDEALLYRLCKIYEKMLEYNLALETAIHLTQIAPKNQLYYAMAGVLYAQTGKFHSAIEMYDKALELGEDDALYRTKAAFLQFVNQSDIAIDIFKTKLPYLLKTDREYAFIQLREKNLEEAREPMYKDLSQPINEEAYKENAIGYFYKLGLDKKFGITEADFKTFKTNEKNKRREKIKKFLNECFYGKDFENKRILIFNKDGAGDLLMFVRYVKLLENHTKNIILQVPQKMQRLIEYSFPECEVVLDDIEYEELRKRYDYTSSYFILLVCLPEISLKEIPFSNKYLDVSEDLIKEKAQFDFIKTQKKKVGLYWHGSMTLTDHRAIKLEKIKPLFDIEQIQYYSFQMSSIDIESDELKKNLNMIDLEPYIKDYADTGAFLKNMDLLITIDTSIANLAGAMGIKTYLLLPYNSEWRWFHDTEKTPWYDSVRIFKQKELFVWEDVVERVKQALKEEFGV